MNFILFQIYSKTFKSYIKANINNRDLELKQRRRPKGSAAQLAAKRRMEEQGQNAGGVERKASSVDEIEDDIRKIISKHGLQFFLESVKKMSSFN